MTIRLADRIEKWPWSKTAMLLGCLVYVGATLVSMLVTLALMVWAPWRPPPSDEYLVRHALDLYELTRNGALFAMGVGGAALVGKRAATKPEVIDAEARAAAVGAPVAPAPPSDAPLIRTALSNVALRPLTREPDAEERPDAD